MPRWRGVGCWTLAPCLGIIAKGCRLLTMCTTHHLPVGSCCEVFPAGPLRSQAQARPLLTSRSFVCLLSAGAPAAWPWLSHFSCCCGLAWPRLSAHPVKASLVYSDVSVGSRLALRFARSCRRPTSCALLRSGRVLAHAGGQPRDGRVLRHVCGCVPAGRAAAHCPPARLFAFLPTGIECMKATKACMLCHKDRWPAYNAVKIAAVRLVCSARAGS